jgi:hypothetical protein
MEQKLSRKKPCNSKFSLAGEAKHGKVKHMAG